MDEDLRTLERAVAADPTDAVAQRALMRARARTSDISFAVEIARALISLGKEDHRHALTIASLVRQVTVRNWGVAHRLSTVEEEAASMQLATPRDGVYVAVRCFWNELQERHDRAPARYSFTFERRITGGPGTTGLASVIQRVEQQHVLGWDVGDEVRAWASSVITDDGGREARWLAGLERVRLRIAVDPADLAALGGA
jgi:hypothetical protein